MEAKDDDHGAFMEKFLLTPPSPNSKLPLHGLAFAIKDMYAPIPNSPLFFLWNTRLTAINYPITRLAASTSPAM
jgi:hypothetical protein